MNLLPTYLVIAIATGHLHGQDPWSRADTATLRLPPTAFTSLPEAIVRDLERRRCRVPQPADLDPAGTPTGVVQGAFSGPARREWAVLCSITDTSRILIYSADSSVPRDSLAKHADRDYLQSLGSGRIGFSRRISATPPARIRRQVRRQPAAGIRQVDHDGLEDHFIGKGSEIFYFERVRWVRLDGSD